MQGATLWKGRQHMHDGIGLPSLYGSEQAVAVHHVGDNGLRPQRGEPAGFFGGSAEAKDLVTACDEGTDQWDTKSAGRAGDEHLHACPSSVTPAPGKSACREQSIPSRDTCSSNHSFFLSAGQQPSSNG